MAKNTKAQTTLEAKSESPKEKKEVGRPTLFKPEFCKLLCEHMAQGFSYGTFGAFLFKKDLVERPIGRSTLYEWEQQFPEFAEAKETAKDLSQLWWESLSINHATHEQGSAQLNATNLIFNMKNRFSDFVKGMDDTQINVNMTEMSDDQLKAIVVGYLDAQKKPEGEK